MKFAVKLALHTAQILACMVWFIMPIHFKSADLLAQQATTQQPLKRFFPPTAATTKSGTKNSGTAKPDKNSGTGQTGTAVQQAPAAAQTPYPAATQAPSPVRNIVRPTFDLGPGGKLTIKDSAFKNGSSAIEPASVPWFQALGEYLKVRPELEVEIRGHASSEGDPATNMRLSEERAETAKRYLVEVYGIPADRIKTRGFGDTAPLQANTDERGRAQNRRVEIVGLSSATRKSLTTESGIASSGDGRISGMKGKVQVRAPWELDFHLTRVGEKIFEYHRIITSENSQAEITFYDSSKIQVYENTSMIIYSPSGNRAADKPRENVKLIEGNLFGRVPQELL